VPVHAIEINIGGGQARGSFQLRNIIKSLETDVDALYADTSIQATTISKDAVSLTILKNNLDLAKIDLDKTQVSVTIVKDKIKQMTDCGNSKQVYNKTLKKCESVTPNIEDIKTSLGCVAGDVMAVNALGKLECKQRLEGCQTCIDVIKSVTTYSAAMLVKPPIWDNENKVWINLSKCNYGSPVTTNTTAKDCSNISGGSMIPSDSTDINNPYAALTGTTTYGGSTTPIDGSIVSLCSSNGIKMVYVVDHWEAYKKYVTSYTTGDLVLTCN
jgi:hypothetical protein